MNTPSIYLLKTFHVFSQEKTVEKAARMLGLTQPTVSRQLKQLEELAPCPLFTVQGNKKTLTQYGQDLARSLGAGFGKIDQSFLQTTQLYLNPRSISLRVAARKEIIQKRMSQLLFEGTLEILPSSKEEIERLIIAQEVDLGVGHKLPSTSAYLSKKFFTSTVKLAVPSAWCTGGKSARDWIEKMAQHPYASYSRELPYLEEFCQKYKAKDQVTTTYYASDWNLLEERIHQGRNWTIMPSEYLQEKRAYRILDLQLGMGEQVFHLFYRKEFAELEWFTRFLSKNNLV